MPAHGHHVAAVKSKAIRHSWYKEGRQARINVPRGNLAQVTATVMAGEIRSNAGEVLREIVVWEQRMFRVLQISGFSISAGIVYPSIWCILHTGLNAGGQVAGGLAVGDWYWHVGVWNIVLQHPVRMVRPRQRMLSRRGTSRGVSTRSQAANNAGHCCHCHLARSSRTNPLQSGQFMDAEASSSNDLPAFGSAIFNFSSAMNNPRISAHVSVLFIENAKEDKDALGAQGKVMNENQQHEAGVSEAVKEQKGKVVASTLEDAEQRGQDKKSGTRKEEDTYPTEAEEETYGWCRIMEEPMED